MGKRRRQSAGWDGVERRARKSEMSRELKISPKEVKVFFFEK
jgi:hypothetical protein